MRARWLAETTTKHLQHSPAVALLGPRQVGKTTLAKKIASERNSVYLDLESPEDQLKLNDPVAFFSLHRERVVGLGEIQRGPVLF